MAIRCVLCSRCIEPGGIDYGIDIGLCGFCSGEFKEDDTRECFDGSPCNETHQDCNKCKWMGKQ